MDNLWNCFLPLFLKNIFEIIKVNGNSIIIIGINPSDRNEYRNVGFAIGAS